MATCPSHCTLAIVLAASSDEQRDDSRIEGGAALADAAHGGRELADVRDAVLEQVADSFCALGEQVERVLRFDVLREHEHTGIRVLLANLARRAKTFVGVGRGHGNDGDFIAIHAKCYRRSVRK